MREKSGLPGMKIVRSKVRLGLVGLAVTALGAAGIATTAAAGPPLPTDSLVFTVEPPASTAATGTGTFTVTVELETPTSSAQTGLTDTIHLAITPGTGAPGAVLACTDTGGVNVPVTSGGGLAVFTGCSITLSSPTSPLNNYTLTATDPAFSSGTLSGVTPGTSSAFAITAGAATHLVFTSQPASGANIGVLSNFSLTVAAEDVNGNINTTYVTAVSLVLWVNPSAATLWNVLDSDGRWCGRVYRLHNQPDRQRLRHPGFLGGPHGGIHQLVQHRAHGRGHAGVPDRLLLRHATDDRRGGRDHRDRSASRAG